MSTLNFIAHDQHSNRPELATWIQPPTVTMSRSNRTPLPAAAPTEALSGEAIRSYGYAPISTSRITQGGRAH